MGDTAESVLETLGRFSKYPLPLHIEGNVRDYAARYGCLRLTRHDEDLCLTARDLPLAEELARRDPLRPYLRERLSPLEFLVPSGERGRLKQALIKLGFPTEDLAGYVRGESLELDTRAETLAGVPFQLRPYQQDAVTWKIGAGRRWTSS